MVKIVAWNCNGLSEPKKIDFLRSNFSDLKNADFTLLVETHLKSQEGSDDLNRPVNFELGTTLMRRNCGGYFQVATCVGVQKSDGER